MNPVREAGRLKGARLPALAPEDRAAAIAAAVAYRGDVELELEGGERILGYLFSSTGDGDSAGLRLLTSEGGRREVKVASLRAIHVTGADKAEGRSWQAWVARHAEKKRLEALGIDSPSVEPQPESLED